MASFDIRSQHVVGEEEKWRGRWLLTKEVVYVDAGGVQRRWECLARTTHSQAECDAVEVLPILKRSGQPDALVVIKQFRAPVGKVFIELPAGLVDASEPTSVAAVRELREETGYVGKVIDSSIVMYLGMAVSNTSIKVVTVEIDGDAAENINPVHELEDGEFTEVVLLRFTDLKQQLQAFLEEGFEIDGKIWLLAHGIELASRLNLQQQPQQ